MASVVPAPTRQHLDRITACYDAGPLSLQRGARAYRWLLARYYNLLIPTDARVLEIGCGSGDLLAALHVPDKTGVDLSPRQIERARARLPSARFYVQAGEELELDRTFDVIIVSDTLNLAADVQELLARLHRVAHPETRLLLNFQNSLWRPLLSLTRIVGLKSQEPVNSWLASSDVLNLLRLSGWSPIWRQNRILIPAALGGIGHFFNRWFAPLLPWFCLTIFMAARPSVTHRGLPRPRVSVIIPARNEAGNIAAAIERVPEMGAGTELVFIEGGSRDDTWEQIQLAAANHPRRVIKTLRQTGTGKGDAVRAGFAAATGDLFMILDADLTVPPEELPKFYDAVITGRVEFANGVRLVYPMGGHAMPFLNLCANKVFSLLFTWMLGQPIKDTLCGTKVLTRVHYEKIAAQRAELGDFDPFGDFDLLFGAARLNLQIADVPVRYGERTYGKTNIQRWRDGWLLLRMVGFAARKLKFV